VPKENFWTLWCKGRLTEADTLTIRLGATPWGLTSAHLHHPPYFFAGFMPFCHPTSNVKALKATSAFGLGRRHLSSPHRCYLHRLRTVCTVSLLSVSVPLLCYDLLAVNLVQYMWYWHRRVAVKGAVLLPLGIRLWTKEERSQVTD